jgi:hypothetical protein
MDASETGIGENRDACTAIGLIDGWFIIIDSRAVRRPAIIAFVMKKLFLAAIFALLPAALFADPGWKEIVTQYMAEVKATKPAPGGIVFPDVTEMISAMFQCQPVTHITAGSSDIYISDTEIYVIQGKPINVDDINVDDESWNLAVTADGVFEWKPGEKRGIKIKRDNKEIIDYLWYLVDPAGFNSGLYGDYLTKPSSYNVVPGKGGKWKEFQLKDPHDGFEAVYVTEKPLWYHGFRVKKPDGSTVEFLISDPEQIQKIPDDVKARLKEIHFEDSTLTLGRHIVFL